MKTVRNVTLLLLQVNHAELRSRLFDLFAIGLSADSTLTVEQRVEGVERAIAYQNNPQSFLERYATDIDELKLQITLARELLPTISRYQIAYCIRGPSQDIIEVMETIPEL